MAGISRRPTLVIKRSGLVMVALVCLTAAFAGEAPAPAPEAPAPEAPAPATPAAPATPQSEAARARAAAIAAKNNIDIGEGWVRATGQDTAASVYLTISSVKDADRLLSVDAAIAESVELRDAPNASGAATAAASQTLDIPATATINFRPGGRHIALVGLKAPLLEGEVFLMTFRFDKAGTQSLPVKVLDTAATSLPPLGSTRKGDTTAAVTQR